MKITYTKEILTPIVESSTTWADVCRKLGVKPMTGSQTYVKKKATFLEIDFSHFLGRASNKGKEFEKKSALSYCFKGSTINSHKLRNKLIRDGVKDKKCEICKLESWLGEDICLELDHIDSDHFNNEISNLQIVCPNCHALETRKRISLCGQNGKGA